MTMGFLNTWNISHVGQLISYNSFPYISAAEIYRIAQRNLILLAELCFIAQRYHFPPDWIDDMSQQYLFPLDGSCHRTELTHELSDVCNLSTSLAEATQLRTRKQSKRLWTWSTNVQGESRMTITRTGNWRMTVLGLTGPGP